MISSPMRKALTTVWLKQHDAAERRLAEVLRRYFGRQAESIIRRLAETGPVAELLFDAAASREELVALIEPRLIQTAYSGAETEYVTVQGMVTFNPENIVRDVPDTVLAGIRRTVTEQLAAPHWLDVQQGTRDRLAAALEDGIASGEGLKGMRRRVTEALGGDVSRARANRIARTEATCSLAGGQHESRRELIQEGLIQSIEWLSVVGDGRTRVVHEALDGTIIEAKGQFNVAGVLVPYPGHWRLGPSQRVNCRCTTATASTFAD